MYKPSEQNRCLWRKESATPVKKKIQFGRISNCVKLENNAPTSKNDKKNKKKKKKREKNFKFVEKIFPTGKIQK